MAKFGELIKKPKVLLCFMESTGCYPSFDPVEMARALSATEVNVIRIPAESNLLLLGCLNFEELPAALYYENGQQKKKLQTQVTTEKVLDYLKTVI